MPPCLSSNADRFSGPRVHPTCDRDVHKRIHQNPHTAPDIASNNNMNTDFTDFTSQLDRNSRGSLLLLWIFRYRVLLGNLLLVSNFIRSSRAQPMHFRRSDKNKFDLHAQRLSHPRKGPQWAIRLPPVVFGGTPLGAAVPARYVPGES